MRSTAAPRRQFSSFESASIIDLSRALREELRLLVELNKSHRAALIASRLRARAAIRLSQDMRAELLGRLLVPSGPTPCHVFTPSIKAYGGNTFVATPSAQYPGQGLPQ